jgi:hypothetical protein
VRRVFPKDWDTIVSLYWKPHHDAVMRVIDTMLPTPVACFAPGERIGEAVQQDGSFEVMPGRETVVARDWLPLTCQAIRWDCGTEADMAVRKDGRPVLGRYISNIRRALFVPCDEYPPLGIGALTGEIVISDALQDKSHNEDGLSALSFVIAHELVHAVKLLPIAVPAFVDWDTFWRSFEEGENNPDDVDLWLRDHNVFVDCYGEENEREELLELWPKGLVDSWWKGCYSS